LDHDRAKMKRKKQKNHHLHNLSPLLIRITDLSRSGAGVGRDENGKAVFVPFTAPGDLVKVKLTRATNKFAKGEWVQLIEPSSQRIEPKCPIFSRCGGCQWQHIPYDLQWQPKVKGVRDSLRLQRVIHPEDWKNFPADQIWFYRNRIQLRGNSQKIGFYEEKSNTLVNISQCFIADEKLNALIAETRVEANQKDKTFKVELSLAIDGTTTKTWNTLHSAAGFRQVNDEQNLNLQAWIKNNLTNNTVVYDLFGGAGNLSIPLMAQATEIHCVDVNVPKSSNLPNYFHFHQSAVLPWLRQYNAVEHLASTALIDPPRNGLGIELREILACLNKLNVTTIILIGCKTDPWSRDIALMIEEGWRLNKVAVFDFFPQTYHVESAALLTRTKKGNKNKAR